MNVHLHSYMYTHTNTHTFQLSLSKTHIQLNCAHTYQSVPRVRCSTRQSLPLRAARAPVGLFLNYITISESPSCSRFQLPPNVITLPVCAYSFSLILSDLSSVLQPKGIFKKFKPVRSLPCLKETPLAACPLPP